MTKLKGQVAIVTGASSGLGEATAVRLAELGARVALFARSRADLDRVAARISGAGGAAFTLPADLADPDAVVAAAERVVSSAGPPRVLVNAAATDAPGPAEDVPAVDWQRVIAVNLTAPFLLSRAVFPHMRAAGGGTIVNVSSVAGRRGWANASAYCATKFGLTGLTQAWPPRVRRTPSAWCASTPAPWPRTGAPGTRRTGTSPGRPPLKTRCRQKMSPATSAGWSAPRRTWSSPRPWSPRSANAAGRDPAHPPPLARRLNACQPPVTAAQPDRGGWEVPQRSQPTPRHPRPPGRHGQGRGIGPGHLQPRRPCSQRSPRAQSP